MDSVIVENANFASLLTTSRAGIYHRDNDGVAAPLRPSRRGAANVMEALPEKRKSRSLFPPKPMQ